MSTADEPSPSVGQIWASTDRHDVNAGRRQDREVLAVDGLYATLLTRSTGRRTRVRLERGRISGHRLIAAAKN